MLKFSFLILALFSLGITASAARESYGYDATEMANQYKDQVFKFTEVDVVIDKGKILILPTKTKGRGTVRPNEFPNFPPPPPIPTLNLCQLTIEHFGTSGDDKITGIKGVKNIFYGNGGNDMLEGGECGDIFYTYDLANPAENKGVSTIVGNGGSDTLNTQRQFKANFTDYDPSKDVINLIP